MEPVAWLPVDCCCFQFIFRGCGSADPGGGTGGRNFPDFAAKGNVWAQILMVVFSILYGIISWRFRYWGEMMTYLGMTLPMAVWSTITWLKNPSETNGSEVAIQQLNRCHVFGLFVSGIIVTVIFVIFCGF